jgi:hypothetical protein
MMAARLLINQFANGITRNLEYVSSFLTVLTVRQARYTIRRYVTGGIAHVSCDRATGKISVWRGFIRTNGRLSSRGKERQKW